MTSGRVIQLGGKTMEASRIFSNDICLTEFDQVMSKRLSVSKWKQELTERSHKSKHKLTHPLCLHLYMDPSSQRSRGWNFVLCRELLLVLRLRLVYWVIYALLEERKGFLCWEVDAGSGLTWLYLLLDLLIISIKLFEFLLHACVSMMFCYICMFSLI